MSLFAAMLYQIKPELSGTVRRHTCINDVTTHQPWRVFGNKRSKQLKLDAIVEAVYQGVDNAQDIADRLSASKALISGYLRELETAKRVRIVRPARTLRSKGAPAYIVLPV
jgi:translation initiation factor 2 beta subunit (eIF-2beta)/eIF-5